MGRGAKLTGKGLSLACAIGLAAATMPGAAAARTLSAHAGWAAIQDEDRCYAIAEAQGRSSSILSSGRAYATVALDGTAPLFHLRFSRSLAPTAVVTLDVGSRRFTLAGRGQDAWAPSDSASRAIVAAMRSSPTMTVGARDAQGRYFRDHYLLAGAPTAIDAAMIACRRKEK